MGETRMKGEAKRATGRGIKAASNLMLMAAGYAQMAS